MPTLRLLPEFEDELSRLPGISAASVVTGPDAVPTEVHVLAEPGKAAKQVVRDVQSFAMAQLDLDIDHRIVSVVQIGADEVGIAVARPTIDPVEPTLDEIEPAPPGDQLDHGAHRRHRGRGRGRRCLATGGHVFDGRVVGPGRRGAPRRAGRPGDAAAPSTSCSARTAEVESAAVVARSARARWR